MSRFAVKVAEDGSWTLDGFGHDLGGCDLDELRELRDEINAALEGR